MISAPVSFLTGMADSFKLVGGFVTYLPLPATCRLTPLHTRKNTVRMALVLD